MDFLRISPSLNNEVMEAHVLKPHQKRLDLVLITPVFNETYKADEERQEKLFKSCAFTNEGQTCECLDRHLPQVEIGTFASPSPPLSSLDTSNNFTFTSKVMAVNDMSGLKRSVWVEVKGDKSQARKKDKNLRCYNKGSALLTYPALSLGIPYVPWPISAPKTWNSSQNRHAGQSGGSITLSLEFGATCLAPDSAKVLNKETV
ncbi:hypothetical protein K439DRAFT_1521202 [Ramaria rubella]|nr:hypothetical protein K439DRAFT_1521202 [Ramaria rubella]